MLKLKAINSNFSKVRVAALSCLFSVFTVQSAIAGPVDISEVPAFLGGTVAPNIMFIIDDSGSMQFELPESQFTSVVRYLFPPVATMYGGGIYDQRIFDFDDDNPRNRLFRSPQGNAFFYNPAKTYEPWFRGDRSQWDDASPTAAPRVPGRSESGTVNLTVSQQHNQWIRSANNSLFQSTANLTYWPITFYMKKEGAEQFAKGSYVKYQVRNGRGYRTDLQTGNEVEISTFEFGEVSRSVTEEVQNFANWFSYYRSRTLAARSGIGNAFSQQGEGLRVGYGRLNKGSSSIDGVSTSVISKGVRAFAGDDREDFFERLYTDGVPASGTPLRLALKRAGEYYERSDNRGPWGADPGNNDSDSHLECRQSFTILMTDGYWSGGSPGVGDVDGKNGPAIDSYAGYRPESPFEDDRSDTLADVAMYFWNRDLRPDLPNDVPTTGINPAFWQHMVTFGVGLGVTGIIEDPKTVFDAIGDEDVDIEWADPFSSEAAKVDDLLHAAVNSRGGFFNAADPDTFATELSGVLTTIVSRVENSATAAAASSAVLRQDSLAFSAGFRSTDWSGALQATEILKGGARGQLIWDAEFELEAKGANSRGLFTMADGQAVELKLLNNLSEAQKDALNTAPAGTVDNLGQSRIDWLRGASPGVGNFRNRIFQPEGGGPSRLRLLGDIIGSNPQYAGPVNYGYRRLPGTEGSSYGNYRSSSDYLARPNVVYVGANDGFLHAFDALTGEELFGYMPGELLEPGDNDSARINDVMERDYSHRFYMNGTPTISDAYINGSWRTILVGAMGVGGRTVFALDISDPENFSASDVLWEFTDPDLGRGVDSPQVVRLPSGEWAAVFGNGYNSDSNESGVFVVDLEDGSLIDKVMTGTGSAANPNGMATPVVLLDQATGIATRAYAGDLRGNLWRVDLNNFNDTTLFTATSPNGSPQPITVAPQIAEKPNGDIGELVVVFGTGSYFRVPDSIDNQVQSLYGIYDDGSNANLARRDLLEQEITSQRSSNFDVESEGVTTTEALDIRVVSDNVPGAGDDGWLLDLDTSGGERVISRAAFPSGFPVKRVRFSTLIPDNNVCGGGREGYLMDIDLLSGGQTDDAVFDLNRDGKFDTGDSAGSDIVNGIRGVVSGEQIQVVLDNTTDLFIDSVIVDLPPDYTGPRQPDQPGQGDDDSDGGTGDLDEPPCTGPLCGAAEGYNFGRQNWEELR